MYSLLFVNIKLTGKFYCVEFFEDFASLLYNNAQILMITCFNN